MKLEGKIALVTGGASGLGEACVRRFAEHGAKVMIFDLNSATGMALKNEIGSAAHFVKTDVSLESDVHNAMNELTHVFGRLDIAVNCAGIATAERAVGKEGPMPLGHFEKVIRINLIGMFNVIRLAAALMMQNEPNAAGERGVIINTASVAAFDGQIGQAAYAASKGGIVGMTLPLAREFARSGIRVMTIAPDIFDTPLMSALPEPARVSLGQQVPFPPRLGRPEEYAHLAHAIIENEMLNGEVIRLDGSIRMSPK